MIGNLIRARIGQRLAGGGAGGALLGAAAPWLLRRAFTPLGVAALGWREKLWDAARRGGDDAAVQLSLRGSSSVGGAARRPPGLPRPGSSGGSAGPAIGETRAPCQPISAEGPAARLVPSDSAISCAIPRRSKPPAVREWRLYHAAQPHDQSAANR